jgi:hypothetical protein
MARRLLLTRSVTPNVNHHFLGAYRLRVEASNAEGVEPYVFMYERMPINPYTEEILDEFFAVASPVDMSEWPAGEPDDTLPFPFFRSNVVEVDLRSAGRVDELWELIQEQVSRLLLALDALDTLEVDDTVWIGGTPDDSTSGSDSDSASES